MRLTLSEPRSGTRWTDSGKSRERRELKHRAAGEVRLVPNHPELVVLLREYLTVSASARTVGYPPAPRRRSRRMVHLEVFRVSRATALTMTEAGTPLMARPYDLRHAAVSTWLNAGVPATQVAEWAGHSVDVLLRVYAKCIAGDKTKPSGGSRRL